MNAFRMSSWCTFTASVALGATIGWNQHAAAQQAADPGANGIEVQTRGPVHEAFAETITFDPKQGVVAPKAPPAAIDELTPLQRPEGENLAWIPGYWAWDDERNDFLWISGIWRALPPGRQWVPGYWDKSQQGVQWTSGYWADANATEVQYLPKPPASLEEGPNVAAPSTDQIWLPGSWAWQQNRYAWQPGYWAAGNQDWDWVPDHYIWTPRGYVFVDGYYDYSVSRRGVAFAPVFFNADVRGRRDFSYTPSAVVNLGVFASHLFLRPNYGHYYFGDYYGSDYTDAGFEPWFSFQSSHRGYDPIYANQHWQHRQDRDWQHRNESNFSNFRDHKDARPPRTWAAQQERTARGNASNPGSSAITTSRDDVARQKDSGFKFHPVDKIDQQQFAQRGQAYREFQEQRQQLDADAPGKPAGDPAAATQPARKSFARSPFVAVSADKLDLNNAPPKRHEVLKPDEKVQPQPKTRGDQPGALQGDQRGTLDESQLRNPKVPRKSDSQSQPEGRDVHREKSKGASDDRLRDPGVRQGKNVSQDQPAKAGESRGASDDKPQNASKSQPKDKKGKD
jgi:hypothetical protein